MKIALDVRSERYQEIADQLRAHGIIVSDDAELYLSERNQYADFLRVRLDGEICHLPVTEIIAIESFGHEVQVRTAETLYRTADRLWQLEKSLDTAQFIRVSNSAIIARSAVRHIRAALSSRFTLTMADGSRIDVTRSYSGIFRDAFKL